MEELNNCFIFWLLILVWGEKVENEGRYVPTSKSARAERGESEDLENRALENIKVKKGNIRCELKILVKVYTTG